MANIKENALPVAGSVTTSDYLRIVTSLGASERASATNLFSGLVNLDTTASPGTTDGDLYAAIVALGWQNDVIE